MHTIFQFEKIATDFIQYYTPKNSENANKVIEFELEVDGEVLLIRSIAPSNYRGIWVRENRILLEERFYEDFWKERTNNGWINVANHDSGWTEGLSLPRLLKSDKSNFTFKKICLGRVPKGSFGVDFENGDHLLPLSETILDFSDVKTPYESYLLIAHALYQPGDRFEVSFTRYENGNRKEKTIDFQENTLCIHKRNPTPNQKKYPLTPEGLEKALKGTNFGLDRIYHSRSGQSYF